jgi:hypothetical protein
VQLPITISLQRSRRLILLLALAHGGALIVVLLLPSLVLLNAALATAIVVSAGLSLHRAWHIPHVALFLGSRGEIEVESAAGTREMATLQPQTTVMPGLIVLLLRVKGRSEQLVLPTDATGAEAHRQLRLWLRWRSATVPA